MIGSGVTVRRAEESDLGAVVRIERDSFADPWSAQSFRSSLALERIQFLVAEDGAEDGNRLLSGGAPAVLGYVIALMLFDDAEIADLAVAPSARRRGVGGLLLDQVLGVASERGVRTVHLEVRESNTAGRALYESRSFLQVGRRSGYYRHPPEDALLLRRDLVRDQ